MTSLTTVATFTDDSCIALALANLTRFRTGLRNGE